jgi:tetratricopeptide (TPR) repeat protein
MKKPQWIFAGAALALTLLVYFTTKPQLFGNHPKPLSQEQQQTAASAGVVTNDSILIHAKEHLTPSQTQRLTEIENGISRGDVLAQKITSYHTLARFWADSMRLFEPYALYTAEAARLENSEKSLTFAAHLFLDNMRREETPELKKWKAEQAKDLFERSLKLNPANDSSQVGLGAVYLYGNLASPMEGIMKIRQVAEKDPNNVYAQITLGQASIISGQFDKAIPRFEAVLKIQPQNIEAILSLAEVYERKGENAKAAEWYRKSLPLMKIPEIRAEIEKRITELSK